MAFVQQRVYILGIFFLSQLLAEEKKSAHFVCVLFGLIDKYVCHTSPVLIKDVGVAKWKVTLIETLILSLSLSHISIIRNINVKEKDGDEHFITSASENEMVSTTPSHKKKIRATSLPELIL